MNKRPLAITIIAWIFIVVCAAGTAAFFFTGFTYRTIQNGTEFVTVHLSEVATVLSIRLLGLIGGIYLLQAKNWARWLLVIWMALHVGISVMHSTREVVVHGIFLIVLVCFLFSPKASAYFKN